MNDINEAGKPSTNDADSNGAKPFTIKLPTVQSRVLRKALPGKKISSQKQFEILRAFAIASTHDKNPVALQDVAGVLQIHQNSVSICNPFFSDIGLIVKQGHKFTPAAVVINYSDRVQWNDENAGHKLAPLIRNTWFADALLPRVTLRPVEEGEAISLFAELSGASPDQRTQLIMLLDFLAFCGLIVRDSGSIRLGAMATNKKPEEHSDNQVEKPKNKSTEKNETLNSDNVDTFQIPIPGKDSAVITIPKGLTDQDWEMLKIMLDAYINRLKEASI